MPDPAGDVEVTCKISWHQVLNALERIVERRDKERLSKLDADRLEAVAHRILDLIEPDHVECEPEPHEFWPNNYAASTPELR
jgi:hypothetical protein